MLWIIVVIVVLLLCWGEWVWLSKFVGETITVAESGGLA